MYLFYGNGLLDVQVLCLREVVGRDPAGIVYNFDMTMLQRWCDGKNVQSSTVAQDALRDRRDRANPPP